MLASVALGVIRLHDTTYERFFAPALGFALGFLALTAVRGFLEGLAETSEGDDPKA